MNDALGQAIESIRSDSGISGLDEASIRQGVVLRILASVGWDPFNLAEVTPEFRVGSGLVDYSLRIAGQSKVFIEVKRGGENLSPHQDQLLRYSFESGVGLATLTNGLEWWFYLPLREGSWEERRFAAVAIASDDKDVVHAVFNNALSKNAVESGSAIEYGENLLEERRRAMLVSQTLPKAWKILTTEPDGLLVDLLSERSEMISGVQPSDSQVIRFLRDMFSQASATERQSSETTQIPNAPSRPHIRRPIVSTNSAARPRNRRNPPPDAFMFLGEVYPVDTWTGMMQTVAEIMYERHPAIFGERVSALRGTSRVYYSRNPEEDLTEPRPIGASGWFVETHWGARAMLDQCHRLIAHFGYNESDLELIEGRQRQ